MGKAAPRNGGVANGPGSGSLGPEIMGVINATPDSLWPGSRFMDPAAAAQAAAIMAEAGAAWIDVGAASSKPGAPRIAPEEEWRRLEPVLLAVRSAVGCRVSVDTRSGDVARRAIAAGADAINDVSALADPQLARAVADAGVDVILSACARISPAADVVVEVRLQWERGLQRARAAGIVIDRCVLDPGFGFGKTRDQSLETVRALPLLHRHGLRVCIGPSRKASSAPARRPPEGRLEGTAALVALAAAYGAEIIRVHDVALMSDVAAMAAAVGAPPSGGRAGRRWCVPVAARTAQRFTGQIGRISLEGVAAQGVHGVLDMERRHPQRFLVDVDLDLDLEPAGRSDALMETVNYAEVARIVVQEVEGPSCALLERLAQRMAGRLMEAFPAVRAGRVRVHKPEAPVGVPFADVSVTYPFDGWQRRHAGER